MSCGSLHEKRSERIGRCWFAVFLVFADCVIIPLAFRNVIHDYVVTISKTSGNCSCLCPCLEHLGSELRRSTSVQMFCSSNLLCSGVNSEAGDLCMGGSAIVVRGF